MGKKVTNSLEVGSTNIISKKILQKKQLAKKLKEKSDSAFYKSVSKQTLSPFETGLSEELSAETAIASPAFSFPDSWVVNVGCADRTNAPIQSFSASWVVPPPPATGDGQLFFIFIGISSREGIIQCMLQWGQTDCGGDQNWSIGLTQVYNGTRYCQPGGSNVQIASGNVVNATITLIGENGQFYSYRLSINNIQMDCKSIFAPRDCCVVLESYVISDPGEYPPAYAFIDNLNIRTIAGTLPLAWVQPNPGFGPHGEHAVIPRADAIALWFAPQPTQLA